MNKENMLKWAEVLESGKYTQHRGNWFENFPRVCTSDAQDAFDNESSACCLGAWNIEAHRQGIRPKYSDLIGFVLSSLYITQGMFDQFVSWNDDDELTFNEIAQKIREMVAEHADNE